MLGKLFVYDMKNQLRLWKFAYVGILVLAVLTAVVRWVNFESGMLGQIWGTIGVLLKSFLLVFGVVMVVAALFYPVLYFRENILRDQGYLMHTLPVEESQLFFSKFLSGWSCILLTILVFLTAIVLMRLGNSDPFAIVYVDDGTRWTLTVSELFFSEEFSQLRGLLLMIFLMIPADLALFLFSLTWGYTCVPKNGGMNRDVLSILVFFGVYIVQELLGILSVVLSALIAFHGDKLQSLMMEAQQVGTEIELSMEPFISVLIPLYGAVTVGLAVAAIGISIFRLKHHLNLE